MNKQPYDEKVAKAVSVMLRFFPVAKPVLSGPEGDEDVIGFIFAMDELILEKIKYEEPQ